METFSCTERKQWRAWLEENWDKCSEIWFVFPTVKSGLKCISYNDAVEEALCFGWIDGRAGRLDEDHHIRRFTPRKKGSKYSQPNIERLVQMDAKGLIHPPVRASIEHVLRAEFVYPKRILNALMKDEQVWKNYCAFPASYRRIRVAYIEAAKKRPKEYKKRLSNFIAKTRENNMISGYGGVDKYYE